MRVLKGLVAASLLCACGPSVVPPEPVAIPVASAPAPPAPSPPPRPEPLTPEQLARAEELLAALAQPGAKREPLLEAMREEVGGAGLVMALSTVPDEPELERWFQTRMIFATIRDLADPDAADALVAWAGKAKAHAHWRGEAGLALAEVGDMRAVPLLVERLGKEPAQLYDRDKSWQADQGGHLSRTDRSRVVAARMLAELSAIHPQRRSQLRRDAEGAVLAWLAGQRLPHANGLRFLATVGTTRFLGEMRALAFPSEPLPPVGAMPPFPDAYLSAQTASRYLGQLRDEESLDDLLAQFTRKDPTLDITQAGLLGASLAMRGMALRAVAYGAAQGLSSWGEAVGRRGSRALMPFIEDRTWHEEAREAGCRALAWVDPAAASTVIDEVVRFGPSADPQTRFIAACYAQTLAERGTEDVAAVVRSLGGPQPAEILARLAAAIGRSTLTAEARKLLRSLVADSEPGVAARVALLLAGDADDVAAALVGLSPDTATPTTSAVLDVYYRALGFVSVDDLESGRLARWVGNAGNAEAQRHPWVVDSLRHQLANLVFDNGPHSLTRVVARVRLYAQARAGSSNARTVLEAMQERGALMALDRR